MIDPLTLATLLKLSTHAIDFAIEYSKGEKTEEEVKAYKLRMQTALVESGVHLDETIAAHPNAPE